jgi:hypothetical protein
LPIAIDEARRKYPEISFVRIGTDLSDAFGIHVNFEEVLYEIATLQNVDKKPS